MACWDHSILGHFQLGDIKLLLYTWFSKSEACAGGKNAAGLAFLQSGVSKRMSGMTEVTYLNINSFQGRELELCGSGL